MKQTNEIPVHINKNIFVTTNETVLSNSFLEFPNCDLTEVENLISFKYKLKKFVDEIEKWQEENKNKDLTKLELKINFV